MSAVPASAAAPSPARGRAGHYRWVICALLFFGTTINYIDRQVIGILKPTLVQQLGWHDEHGPRATMQITPDGDYTQSGVQWNKVGYTSATHRQYATAPQRSGLYYFRASTASGPRPRRSCGSSRAPG